MGEGVLKGFLPERVQQNPGSRSGPRVAPQPLQAAAVPPD